MQSDENTAPLPFFARYAARLAMRVPQWFCSECAGLSRHSYTSKIIGLKVSQNDEFQYEEVDRLSA